MADPEAVEQVRLLIADTDNSALIFWDDQLEAFLTLEGGSVKLAAAQALDTIASNEALVSKVISTQDASTDGAKVAETLRKHAANLRGQVAAADEAAGFFFDVVDTGGGRGPELVEWA